MWPATAFGILLCALAVWANPAVEIANDVQSSIDNVHAAWIDNKVLTTFRIHGDAAARKKRQVAWESEETETDLDESTMCVLNCAMQFKTAANRLPQSVRSATTTDSGDLIKQDVNLTSFIETCRIMRPSIQCFDRCPDSSVKVHLTKSLDLLRYMCIERIDDIKKNSRCMQKIAREVSTECSGPCRRFEESVTRLRVFGTRPYLRFLYSQSQIMDMLSGTCKFIHCRLDCNVRMTRRSCGDTAADLNKALVQRAMATVQLWSSSTYGSDFLPASCQRLADGNEYDAGSDESTPEPPTPEPTRYRLRSAYDFRNIRYGDSDESTPEPPTPQPIRFHLRPDDYRNIRYDDSAEDDS